jgi:hypothetical protein
VTDPEGTLETEEIEEPQELQTLEDDDDADTRPDGRSDRDDPWHGLNDFDE